jgi:hypothetical protein
MPGARQSQTPRRVPETSGANSRYAPADASVTDRRRPYGALARSRSRDRIADAAGPSAPLARRLKPRVNANVEPVLCEFEPSLFDQNPDIEHSRPETGARNWPDLAQNGEKIASETRHHLVNSRECRANSCRRDMPCRDRTGWLGWQDSNFGIRRRSGGANQALILRCRANRSPIFLAEATGLPLQTERQCRQLMWPFLPRLGSRPAGDTATVGLRW